MSTEVVKAASVFLGAVALSLLNACHLRGKQSQQFFIRLVSRRLRRRCVWCAVGFRYFRCAFRRWNRLAEQVIRQSGDVGGA